MIEQSIVFIEEKKTLPKQEVIALINFTEQTILDISVTERIIIL